MVLQVMLLRTMDVNIHMKNHLKEQARQQQEQSMGFMICQEEPGNI